MKTNDTHRHDRADPEADPRGTDRRGLPARIFRADRAGRSGRGRGRAVGEPGAVRLVVCGERPAD